MASIRAFVALYPDPSAQAQIQAFRDRLRAGAQRSGIRWAKDDQLHLTLRFFGELPEETLPKLVERLGGTCKGTGALDVEAVFAGAPWRGARVIALEVVEPTKRLAKLQARIETDAQAAGQPAENRAFRPHLTLARLEHPDFQPAAAHASVAGWSVAELALVKSVLGPGGAMHSVVAHFPLQ